ncbi:MAG: hypothetical protein EOP88_03080 [Verrucomicrobiaceae bacterium]|nr:MAG: hypothetical protein EOP88_03080 [Verrucomicrobiaceae bacterium]
MSRQVSLIFDSDSQYFACRNLVAHFLAAGWSIQFVILGEFELPPPGNLPPMPVVRVETLAEIWKIPAVVGSTAIGAYLPGSKLREIWLGAEDHFSRNGTRPILFTGYNGVVLQRFEDGMGWRVGYDLIALNSPEDREKAMAFSSHSTLQRATLMPIIGINRTDKPSTFAVERSASWGKTRTVVFAEQVLFPRGPKEKYSLYSHMIRIALENPDWKVVVKPRTPPDGFTFHRQSDHISRFIERNFILPSNMSICYEPLDELLKKTTALLSISSTAFFDAVGTGVPSFTLSDFGISSTYGTHFFHGSGCTICLASLGKLSHGLFESRPTQEWLELKGFSPKFSPANIIAALEELKGAGANDAPLIPFESEQRLLAFPADLPAGNVAARTFWVRLTSSPNAGTVQHPPANLRKTLARIRRRIVGMAGGDAGQAGSNGKS